MRITSFRKRERPEPEISRGESPERIGMTRIIPSKSEVPDPPYHHTKQEIYHHGKISPRNSTKGSKHKTPTLKVWECSRHTDMGL